MAVRTTKSGRESVSIAVQLVDHGDQIHMYFEYDLPPIAFNKSSGRSGPKAYERLKKIFDLEK